MSGNCPTCGGPLESIRGDWKFQEGGLQGVILKNIEILRCGHCGDAPVIPRLEGVLRSVALALAQKRAPLEPWEIAYLRKHAELSGEGFAVILGVFPETLKRWETGQETPPPEVDRLIRLAALSVAEGLADHLRTVARGLASIRPDRQPLAIEIDPDTMQYRYAA